MQLLQRISGLTQQELADKLNKKQTTISYQCRNDVKTSKFLEYCKKLDIDPSEVLKYR